MHTSIKRVWAYARAVVGVRTEEGRGLVGGRATCHVELCTKRRRSLYTGGCWVCNVRLPGAADGKTRRNTAAEQTSQFSLSISERALNWYFLADFVPWTCVRVSESVWVCVCVCESEVRQCACLFLSSGEGHVCSPHVEGDIHAGRGRAGHIHTCTVKPCFPSASTGLIVVILDKRISLRETGKRKSEQIHKKCKARDLSEGEEDQEEKEEEEEEEEEERERGRGSAGLPGMLLFLFRLEVAEPVLEQYAVPLLPLVLYHPPRLENISLNGNTRIGSKYTRYKHRESDAPGRRTLYTQQPPVNTGGCWVTMCVFILYITLLLCQ